MDQKPRPIVSPPLPTRPYLLDYFFLLGGFGLSLYLMDLSPLTVEPAEHIVRTPLRAGIVFLPRLLRIPEGVILFFPIFFGLQFVLGRRQEISSGEWLWIFTWLGTMTLTGIAVWRHLLGLPELLEPHWLTVRWFWHLAFGAAMALIALILVLFGLIRRSPMPWTHGFGLVLAIWPILPLAGILLLTKK